MDLRIAALEQIGRKEETQAARWAWFRAMLSLKHLRAYLRRLPDLAAADALVCTRLDELDGRAYEVLTAAAERLAGKHPAAASLLYQRMAESILARGSSRQYGYAAREVRNSASLAGRVVGESGVEGHEAFVARLKRAHGRKWCFWWPCWSLGISDVSGPERTAVDWGSGGRSSASTRCKPGGAASASAARGRSGERDRSLRRGRPSLLRGRAG